MRFYSVAPLVGAWIEIRALAMKILEETVAPLVGAWIEIDMVNHPSHYNLSLLSWERGLKYTSRRIWRLEHTVAPLVGAWIEISTSLSVSFSKSVAPLVGAWIEIIRSGIGENMVKVAPLVGAWIEIKV